MLWSSEVKYRKIMNQKYYDRIIKIYQQVLQSSLSKVSFDGNQHKILGNRILKVKKKPPISFNVVAKIGEGTYGAIYALDDNEHVIKIEKKIRFPEKYLYDELYQDESVPIDEKQNIQKEYEKLDRSDLAKFCYSIAISALLGEQNVGPPIVIDECFVTEKLQVNFNGRPLRVHDDKDEFICVTKMKKYTMDLLDFCVKKNEMTPDDISKIEKKLGEGIDKLHEIGIICSDIKPANALVLYNFKEKTLVDVCLSDFDTKFCCLKLDSSTSIRDTVVDTCPSQDTTDSEHNKLATKMQMSWATYIFSRKKVVLFKKELMEFLSIAIEDEDLIPRMKQARVLDQFDHYVVKKMLGTEEMQNLNKQDLKANIKLLAQQFILKLADMEEKQGTQKDIISYIQNRIETRQQNVEKFVGKLKDRVYDKKPKREKIKLALKRFTDALAEMAKIP